MASLDALLSFYANIQKVTPFTLQFIALLFADESQKARLNIDDILLSSLLGDFLELRDYEIIADQSQLNPFSLNYTKRIYGMVYLSCSGRSS